MKWTVQQKIRAGFWLLALVPVIIGTLAVRTAMGLSDSARHLAATNDISRGLEKLLAEVNDLEVAWREYIMSGDSNAVDAMMKTTAEIEEDIRKLNELRKQWKPGAQDTWMATLELLIPEKLYDIQRTIQRRNDEGQDAAWQELLASRDRGAKEDMRVVVRTMIEEEKRRLEAHSREQETDFNTTVDLFIVVLLVNVALLGMIYYLQRRETERAQEAQEELERRVALRTEALQRSNEDLQQFAYIASHDLKEPLRMISSYTTLLQRRYQGKLDGDADTYITFIVDGVKRMHALIQDILEYSRAGTGKDEELSEVKVDDVLRNVMANLKVTIAESGASVKWEKLPDTVPYDSIRLTQIFQNLIGNAIKYRGDRKPDVRIEAVHEGEEIIFSVRDNGIGIAPEFKDQIFGIFQRLHGKEYEGTGIGLAMVKKIIERHGGRIWVESTPGTGSTFYFTVHLSAPLPASEAFSTSTS
jgi:signal transduction histidine kinase